MALNPPMRDIKNHFFYTLTPFSGRVQQLMLCQKAKMQVWKFQKLEKCKQKILIFLIHTLFYADEPAD